jgi:hypothetical protein
VVASSVVVAVVASVDAVVEAVEVVVAAAVPPAPAPTTVIHRPAKAAAEPAATVRRTRRTRSAALRREVEVLGGVLDMPTPWAPTLKGTATAAGGSLSVGLSGSSQLPLTSA